jgi:putative nucleotidyltransferase with HDIG domain
MSIENILESVGRLPSPPRAIIDIVRTLEDGDSSPETLARQIETDMGLITSVLRLVNSSLYGISGGVPSIRQAIVLLGFNAIRNLVCVHGISDYFQQTSAGKFNYENFIHHSIGVGCIAKVFAKQVSISPDTAFVAAMLHDVGQFALATTAPDQYRQIMEYKKEKNCLESDAEIAIIGIDHAKVGAHLAKHWHLPVEICNAIEFHHQPPDISSNLTSLTDLIHVGEILAHAMELGTSEQVSPLSDNAMLRLRLSLHQVATSLGKIEEEYIDYIQLMGV